ncbi:MAG: hypothetical protein QOI83_408 [Streptomycetaceae bacterium]|nr:hypothetical protein [Streptomycetaceae bacterium]
MLCAIAGGTWATQSAVQRLTVSRVPRCRPRRAVRWFCGLRPERGVTRLSGREGTRRGVPAGDEHMHPGCVSCGPARASPEEITPQRPRPRPPHGVPARTTTQPVRRLWGHLPAVAGGGTSTPGRGGADPARRQPGTVSCRSGRANPACPAFEDGAATSAHGTEPVPGAPGAVPASPVREKSDDRLIRWGDPWLDLPRRSPERGGAGELGSFLFPCALASGSFAQAGREWTRGGSRAGR